ncbi:ATP-dependent helicase HrpB [Tuwongella immobilis]|uniref:ATP-dependent helicase HrpB n=1 Tax=Tuwongella immobilis TaxID=692036 RepID=UPI001E4D637B|nr:ATP-dependent helicase HrpB [Tuwongella immobilis]
MGLPRFPIDDVLPELIRQLRDASSVVLRAPTGAGKTTRVPPALLDAGFADSGWIVMLEPRRVAARAAARRMASERGEPIGETIGYQVRLERVAGPRTRILVVTPGILLRMLQDDPFLEKIAVIVMDEFHERSLEGDLVLGMTRLVQTTVRPELKLLLMSATLADQRLSAYLGDCPIVRSEGRLYPVQLRYHPRRGDADLLDTARDAIERIWPETPGDLLVFLPGVGEIRTLERELQPFAAARGVRVMPLYGDLPAEQQDLALRKFPERKIVLATNVAETSVTVDGVTAVIDTGLARQNRFDASVGLDRLELVPIAQDSADQRAGRAGRTQPGICVRLWEEAGHRQRPETTLPEIQRIDLSGALLHLLCLGEAKPEDFLWLDAPRSEALEQAFRLLRRLGAVDANGVTELGRAMGRLPLHPRLARMVLDGAERGVLRSTLLAAVLLTERDPIQRRSGIRSDRQSDVLDRLDVLEQFQRTGRTEFPVGNLVPGAARQLLRLAEQLERQLAREGVRAAERPSQSVEDAEVALLRALLAGFPDRVAKRREPGSRRARMVGGRGVQIGPMSGVDGPEYFLAIDVDGGGSEALVRMASGIERSWLPESVIVVRDEVEFDEASGKIQGRRRRRYDDLILEESPIAIRDSEAAAELLAEVAASRLEQALPDSESAAGQWLNRLRCLAEWVPDVELPRLDEAGMREILRQVCRGCRSLDEVRQADWIGIIQGMMDYATTQWIEREAPERLEVPSGSRIALRYEPGRPPILAVRIQELFGLTETPRIARGRVPVLLHLLAPNYRPQQITDDLSSFWANVYPQVRKDLRARYPKHAWPEDPWTATAQSRPQRRPS